MSAGAMDGTVDHALCDYSCGFSCGQNVKGKRGNREEYRPPTWDRKAWEKIPQRKGVLFLA